MIVIVGESASGKSSVAQCLRDKYGFKRIITYTTRPPRTGEIDLVDYHFINDARFEELERCDYFAETASYNGWKYGSAIEDYNDDSVIILTPRGLRSVKQLKERGINKNIVSFYINVPRRDRLIKCLERGDNIEEAYRRSLSDVGQFDGIENEVDLTIMNSKYELGIVTITDIIFDWYKKNERI